MTKCECRKHCTVTVQLPTRSSCLTSFRTGTDSWGTRRSTDARNSSRPGFPGKPHGPSRPETPGVPGKSGSPQGLGRPQVRTCPSDTWITYRWSMNRNKDNYLDILWIRIFTSFLTFSHAVMHFLTWGSNHQHEKKDQDHCGIASCIRTSWSFFFKNNAVFGWCHWQLSISLSFFL